MSEVFSMNDLSIGEQYSEEVMFKGFGSKLGCLDTYVNTISNIGHLELVKRKVEIMVGTLYDEIDSKLYILKTSKNFDLEKMVKSLPVEVINLIKEFMSDDVEIVRKSFVLFNFNPWPYNLRNKIEFVCRKINKKKLRLILQETTAFYLPKSKKKDFFLNTIESELSYFYAYFLPNAPLQQTMKEIVPYSINKKYLTLRLLQIMN